MKPKHILLAFDSFKGSLSSAEIAECIEETIMGIDPMITVDRCLMSDGGEGMLETMKAVLPLYLVTKTITGPLGSPEEARLGWDKNQRIAVIESAQANGLPLVAVKSRNPLKTTAYGVGELIRAALDLGAETIIVGLGGSATNEAGLSILQALGAVIRDQDGNPLPTITGELLEQVQTIDLHKLDERLEHTKILAACDVNNPLTGPNGATYVYGPQKGANSKRLPILEAGMENVRTVIKEKTGIDLNEVSGAGAAGGIAGGLYALLKAELKSGINVILQAQRFEKQLKNVDLVLTGEGKSDQQTLMGKVPMGVLRTAQKIGVPVILVSGIVEEKEAMLNAGFKEAIAIKPQEQSVEDAVKPGFTKHNLRQAIKTLFGQS